MAYTSDELPSGLEAKATPVDADVLVLGDSADSNRAKKTTWAQNVTALAAETQTLTNKTIDLTNNTLATTSLQLKTALTDETGSGAAVFATSPTLVTPALGTPSSGVLTNTTGTAAGLTAGAATLAISTSALKSATTTVNVDSATAPSVGQVLKATSSTAATWQAEAAGAPEGTAVLSTGEVGGTKFLREDGDGTCSWQAAAGSGNVSNSGTPVNNQLAVWTDATTVEGDAALTFDTTTDTLAIGASGILAFGAVSILTDSAGTTTLNNIDAIDATTEATIEAAIDTLANLTSVQGNTLTLAGAFITSGANSLTLTTTGSTNVTLPTSGTLLADIVSDTTPQLGGELDAQANSIGFTMQTATGDGTTTVDWGNGNHIDFTFGAFNETFTFTAPAKTGVYTMSLKQDSTGSRTATWPGTVKWPSGTAPTLTTTGTTGYDMVGFRFDGTNYYGVATLDFS